MNRFEAQEEWGKVYPALKDAGLCLDEDGMNVKMFIPDEWKRDGATLAQIAMDEAGTLSTSQNSALPALLTTAFDPDVIRVVFAPLAMADILGEERRVGAWTDQTRIFPVVEDTGEVSSYSDYSTSGRAGINFNYPNFQSYLFQTFVRYGELETARAGLLRINYVGDLQRAAANVLNRFGNFSYAFGIAGLQNYGLLNNPFLSSYLTPALKAWGGTTWFNGNTPAATANEVYNDILAVINKLLQQTNGVLTEDSKMTLAMGPVLREAMGFTNAFGVTVRQMLKESFPSITIKTAPQYGTQSSSNSQGFSTAGNLIQLIADEIDGQKVAYPAYNEKLRAHKLVPEASSWQQKYTSGSWGTILRIPVGISGMLGV